MNFNRNKYAKKRLRTDPAFRRLKNKRQRERYAHERLLLRKIAAHGGPVEDARHPIDTLLAGIHSIAAGALGRLGISF